MAEVFANPLAELAEYTDMKQDMDKGKGPIQVSGVTDSQKVHVMHELSKDNPWRLVVTYDDTRAKEIFDDFSYFEPNTWLYPARDLLFYSSDIHGNLLTRQRMQVFKHLLEDEGGGSDHRHDHGRYHGSSSAAFHDQGELPEHHGGTDTRYRGDQDTAHEHGL